MNYMVIWRPAALQELTAVWLASANRNAVTAAAHAIDIELAAAPHSGNLIFDVLYEYTHQPLGVEYEVVDADCRILILAVWDTATGRPVPTGN